MIASWNRGFSAAKAASMHASAPSRSKSMGAALVQGGKIVAIGFNLYSKTHPKSITKHFVKSVHAEQAALVKRQHYDNKGQIMYVYRETADGAPACSRPCPNCQELMRLAGISKVRYIDEDGNPKEEKL